MPKEYICDQCEKRFTRGDKYNEHMKVHREGKFVCANWNNCHTEFTSKRAKDLHEKTCLGGKHKHECDQCDKSFPVKHMLEQHINREHTKEDARKQWFCNLCGKPFTGGKFHGILRSMRVV